MNAGALVEPAPAKVNLTLDVTGRRADGYHDLDSIVVFARDAADRVTLHAGGDSGLTVTGPRAAEIVGENILIRTIEALARRPNIRLGRVGLEKNLPVAAGIGGGSADAAALLRAVRGLNPHVEEAFWSSAAVALGADLPVCLLSRPARLRGKGERLEPIADFPILHAVLANPMAEVPPDKTARVFRALGLAVGAMGLQPARGLPPVRNASELVDYLAGRDNGLTSAAASVVPAIGDVLAGLAAMPGCHLARMSGAGPTCFGLFETPAAARGAATRLAALQPRWWVQATRLG